jgi:hypothetical protein
VLFLTEYHALKAYWGIGGIAPCILDLGTRWRWVVSFKPQPIYPQGKSPWYPLNSRLGGLQSRSGHGGKEKNSQLLPGLEPPIIQHKWEEQRRQKCVSSERSQDSEWRIINTTNTFGQNWEIQSSYYNKEAIKINDYVCKWCLKTNPKRDVFKQSTWCIQTIRMVK